MVARTTFLSATLCCVVTACATESIDDPQGTYQLTISLRPLDPLPSQVPLPTTISWSETAELRLAFDDAGRAQVRLLGYPAQVAVQEQVNGGSLRFGPSVAAGSLMLGINSVFGIHVDDPVACPQRGPLGPGSYFELFFLDGHVHGATADVVSCYLPEDGFPAEGFVFDVTGERVSE